MLLAARKLKSEGRDVVIGIVETHGRSETAVLLDGLEVLPPKAMAYRGKELTEFDLDAALLRRPALRPGPTNSRTRTFKVRATPSAGRTSRNYWRRVSMYLRH